MRLVTVRQDAPEWRLDDDGLIRDQHFGEGRYEQSERVIQRLHGVDRIRMVELSGDTGVFVRSMASRGSLGGVSEATLQAALLMDAAGKPLRRASVRPGSPSSPGPWPRRSGQRTCWWCGRWRSRSY